MGLLATLPNLSNLFVKKVLVIADVVLTASTHLLFSAAVPRTLNLELIFITKLQ